MAKKIKYKLKKGEIRTPEQYRNIINEIDSLQRKRSATGVHLSKKKMYNVASAAKSTIKKSKKQRIKQQSKIYDMRLFE